MNNLKMTNFKIHSSKQSQIPFEVLYTFGSFPVSEYYLIERIVAETPSNASNMKLVIPSGKVQGLLEETEENTFTLYSATVNCLKDFSEQELPFLLNGYDETLTILYSGRIEGIRYSIKFDLKLKEKKG